MIPDLLALLAELHIYNQAGIAWAEYARKTVVKMLLWGMGGGLVLMLILNVMGAGEWNFLIGLVLMGVATYWASHTQAIIPLAEVAAIYGAVVTGVSVPDAVKRILSVYGNVARGIVTAIGIVTLILGAIPFKENPLMLFVGLFLCLVGYLLLTALGKPGKLFLWAMYWLVWIVGIAGALSLVPASTWVQYTGHDLGSWFRHDIVIEAAQGVLDADNARQERAKAAEIKRLQKKAGTVGLTTQERAELQELIKERSVPGRVSSAIKGRQPVAISVPLSLTGKVVRLPEELSGAYSISIPEGLRIPFKCPDGTRGELLPGGVNLASGRDRDRGELLLNGVRPWETIRLGGESSLDARLALDMVNNQCPGMVVTGSLPTISVTLTPVGS